MAASPRAKANTKQRAGAKPRVAKSNRGKLSGRKAARIPSSVGKHLVVVESPAKARTVGQILGDNYVVAASLGHLRDLPRSGMGVDIERDFQPSYEVMNDKRAILKELKAAGDQAVGIYLATDPDREGEAISWHLQAAADWDRRPDPPKRVVFHEITREAVKEAFEHPREIDMQLVNAQQARRILDRLVGYQISPLLGRKVQWGLSAGRVQSVALRMVVDREREIQSFVPVESWTVEAQLRKQAVGPANDGAFAAVLHSAEGRKGRLAIPNEEEARRYQLELTDAAYSVASVKKREVRQRPAAPFTTSTMQQEAGRKLRFTAQRTMVVAQQLYEGLPVDAEGPMGLITYMRTDSTQVASSALGEARAYILKRYGKEYLPEKPRVFTRKAKAAQEAHEAIRPTSIQRDPESLKAYLNRDQLNLYRLIWERMLASQMADARSDSTTVDIEALCRPTSNVYLFRATGSVLKFLGFRTLYLESRDDEAADEDRKSLPELGKGDPLECLKLDTVQHFTEPPHRFTEATLIKGIEEKGIGRPSTYAPTIGTLLDRQYVTKEQNHLVPSALGTTVTDLLTEYFANVMDLDFTAKMEEELDDVSRGEREWVSMLSEFYGPFQKALEVAQASMPRTKVEEHSDEVCESCGRAMVIKTGRFGRFLACTGYPECKTSRPLLKKVEEHSDEVCESCGRAMVIKTGRFGRFLACTGYPECKTSRPLKTGAACPQCGGDIVERLSRGRRLPFFGCSRYPTCDFLSNRRPVPTPCPECGGLMVQVEGATAACTVCKWTQPLPQQEEELVPTGD